MLQKSYMIVFSDLKYFFIQKNRIIIILFRVFFIVFNFILNKISMVRDRRFELPRPKIGHKILSLARLPIPPIPQGLPIYNTIFFYTCQEFLLL